ncbi:DUF5707 domain-containing protein [Streptomyces sp. YIM S03343]
MSKRIVVSSLIGITALGAVAAGGYAMASTNSKPTLKNGSAHYTAPSGNKAGSFTFAADVSDDSGIRGLKVLVWPASSKLDPNEAELRHVESATCRSTSDETTHCVYTLKVTTKDAADLDPGTWKVSALATAKDGDTLFVPQATAFEVAR